MPRPPRKVRENAKRGLALRHKHKRGGTQVGVARARDLSNNRNIPQKTLKRMNSYFARHETDKKGKNFNNKTDPSAGKIAWLLWGGEEGKRWVKRELSKK